MTDVLENFANVGENIGKSIHNAFKKVGNATAISAIVCVVGAIVFVSCLIRSTFKGRR